MIDLCFRPYDVYPVHSRRSARQKSVFRVDYAIAIDHLKKELEAIGAKNVLIATAHRTQDVRNDGWPRSNAHPPTHPGVVLYCESRYGSLAFPCDAFDDWRDNLRAIALTLESLRAVGQYGAAVHGEPYQGFAQAAPANGPTVSADPRASAAQTLLRHAGMAVDSDEVSRVLESADRRREVYGEAVKRAHPDQGGTAEAFIAVRAAWEALTG